MKKTAKGDRLTKALKIDYTEEENIWLTNSATLRRLIGILGMALPLLLWWFLSITSHYNIVLESISHYYYTRAGSIFTIIISLMAIFLIVYKGKDPVDFYLSFAAGIFALCVLLFPTSNITETCCQTNFEYSVTFIQPSKFRHNFHYISAGIFLGCLAYMSLFIFTRSSIKKIKDRGRTKNISNGIYICCGIMMLIAMSIIFSGFLGWIDEAYYTKHHLTYWMEVVAVEFFGLSWLVKGQTIFK
ncbi:hypothetical protein [Pedobacter sp. Hv1]|uniref:hypothetical protein n=1 Tax=Pedobacter sp. Hv1 TaxID=1740090 RepID=UPI000B1DA581|nr:hypothetical protein [Pedobacter sp. Hv1]